MPKLSDLPCRNNNPDLWFPVGTGGLAIKQANEAKGHCAACPIKQPCLEWALKLGEQGIWGGTDEAERRVIRRHEHVHPRRSNEDHRTREPLVRVLASK